MIEDNDVIFADFDELFHSNTYEGGNYPRRKFHNYIFHYPLHHEE